MTYTLLIDESGDEGIEPEIIEKGASPLFFFGAVLIKTDDLTPIRATIEEIANQTQREPKRLHFSEFSHRTKVLCCQKISDLPITIFGIISDKSQLKKAGYLQRLRSIKGGFYNKNAAFLLELVGKYVQEQDIALESIIFEEKKHDYNRMKNYLRAVKTDKVGVRRKLNYQKGFRHNADLLKNIDTNAITTKTKPEESLLFLADMVANSLYNACVPCKKNITEPRYLEEITNTFHSDSNGRILNHGINVIMNIQDMNMQPRVQTLLTRTQ